MRGTRKRISNPYRIEGDVAVISLTQGQESVIDAADLPLVLKYRWCACRSRRTKTYYAQTMIGVDKVWRVLYMHRLINGTPKGAQTDHRDGNGLNNRRVNLRTATIGQNIWNAGKRNDNSSGFRGVNYHKPTRNWQARIKHHGKQISLGYFPTPEAAAQAYQVAALELRGQQWTRSA